jgi:hypothetical protein
MEEERVSILPDEKPAATGKGKEEAPVREKSFLERADELVKNLKSVTGFKDHAGVGHFKTVIESTGKREGAQRVNLENALLTVFRNFYNEHSEEILEGRLDFLSSSKTTLICGSSGKASLPLSEIYKVAEDSNPEMLDTIEASLFFVFQHVCPDEDLEKLLEICQEFEPDKPAAAGNFMGLIGNIIGRVTDRLEGAGGKSLETEDGKINTDAVGGVVGDLMGDDVIQRSMQDMMNSVTGENFNINEVFKGLMGMAGNESK